MCGTMWMLKSLLVLAAASSAVAFADPEFYDEPIFNVRKDDKCYDDSGRAQVVTKYFLHI